MQGWHSLPIMPGGGPIMPGGGPPTGIRGGPGCCGLICGGADTWAPRPPGAITWAEGPPTPRTGPCNPAHQELENIRNMTENVKAESSLCQDQVLHK